MLECESCGRHVNMVNVHWLGIRCVYCQRVFCEPCAIQHFEDDEVQDLEQARAEAAE